MDNHNDDGVIAVLLERLNKQRLPKLLSLKKRVNDGEKLDDRDIAFLDEALKDAHFIQPLFDRHPDFQQLRAHLVSLYHEITEKALENEQR